jgi:hypothetical protein
MNRRILSSSLVAAATLLAGAAPAASDPSPAPPAAAVLGDEGQLYQVFAGTFGELFPDDATQPADSRVLALDVIAPDGSRERSLVPGTAGPEVDSVPSLVFEDASRRLYTVWESKTTPTISRILLASFGAEGWSEPIEVSGDVSPLKDEPRVLITRDRFSVLSPEGIRTARSRTAIHVVWREEGPGGSGLFYTPVILERGRYLGWNPVVALSELDPSPVSAPPAPETAELLSIPELAPGQDLHSAILAFLSPASGRLLTIEIRLFPGELGFLADDFRGQIIDIGNRDRGDFENLARRFRGQIIDIGNRLNRGVLGHFAERSSSALLALYDAAPDRPLEALADDFRGQIIDIGRELLGGPRGGDPAASRLIEVAPPQGDGTPPADAPGVPHLLGLQTVLDRPIPPLGGVPGRVFVSEDGERVLVGWLERGKVYYTETSSELEAGEGPWTEVRHLTLTEQLGAVAAAGILENRVRRQR